MIKKIEHIGIAVRDLKGSNEIFKKIFGNSHYKVEKVESEGVSTSFFKIGETKIELLEATNALSAAHKKRSALEEEWLNYTMRLEG